ncbi:hypothetical protein V1280_000543 [Bradyrhizobium sp. AZCC 2230]
MIWDTAQVPRYDVLVRSCPPIGITGSPAKMSNPIRAISGGASERTCPDKYTFHDMSLGVCHGARAELRITRRSETFTSPGLVRYVGHA